MFSLTEKSFITERFYKSSPAVNLFLPQNSDSEVSILLSEYRVELELTNVSAPAFPA
ncbi:MAG: hypothetical protein R3A12_07095 [Ignavibacteria bacterium]